MNKIKMNAFEDWLETDGADDEAYAAEFESTFEELFESDFLEEEDDDIDDFDDFDLMYSDLINIDVDLYSLKLDYML